MTCGPFPTNLMAGEPCWHCLHRSRRLGVRSASVLLLFSAAVASPTLSSHQRAALRGPQRPQLVRGLRLKLPGRGLELKQRCGQEQPRQEQPRQQQLRQQQPRQQQPRQQQPSQPSRRHASPPPTFADASLLSRMKPASGALVGAASHLGREVVRKIRQREQMQRHVAVFMVGLPAAGKSRQITQRYSGRPRMPIVVVDLDAEMVSHPDYDASDPDSIYRSKEAYLWADARQASHTILSPLPPPCPYGTNPFGAQLSTIALLGTFLGTFRFHTQGRGEIHLGAPK